MSTPTTAASRILAQTRQMQGKDVLCEKCGSNYFYEVQTSMYRAGGQGSVEIQVASDAQVFPLLKCAGCDFPVLPKPATGRRHGGVYESAHKEFRTSIEAGQKFLNSLDPEVVKVDVKADVMTAFAGKYVEGKVESLADRLNNIEGALGGPEHAAQDKDKNKGKAHGNQPTA